MLFNNIFLWKGRARALCNPCLPEVFGTDRMCHRTDSSGERVGVSRLCAASHRFQIPDPRTAGAPDLARRARPYQLPPSRRTASPDARDPAHELPKGTHKTGQTRAAENSHPRLTNAILAWSCTSAAGQAGPQLCAAPALPFPRQNSPDQLRARCKRIPRHGRTPGEPDTAEVEGLPRRTSRIRRGSTPCPIPTVPPGSEWRI